jgi:neutral ceramidase
VVGLCLLGAFAFASSDRCGEWPSTLPTLGLISHGSGALLVGAAKTQVVLPHDVTVGGYGPVRSSASTGDPVSARTVLVEVGGQRFALVSLEVLLLTQPLVAAIRQHFDFPIIITATHTHSSVGQFDRRLASQVAALGTFDAAVEAALVAAARSSIENARKEMSPVTMEVRSFDTGAFVRARSSDAVDTRGLEVAFARPDGERVARWVLIAAHPTLAPPRGDTFDTDWPGAYSEVGAGVTLVLQTSVGNASVNKEVAPSEHDVVAQLTAAQEHGVRVEGCEQPTLGIAAARVSLPHPDGSRLAPWPFRAAVENALCAASEMDVEVMMVRLGCVSLLALPVEPSFASAQRLEKRSGATRVLALSNGYIGYLEPADVVQNRLGEAKRQWFGAELFESLASASLFVASASDAPGHRGTSQ